MISSPALDGTSSIASTSEPRSAFRRAVRAPRLDIHGAVATHRDACRAASSMTAATSFGRDSYAEWLAPASSVVWL
jgi:hypothetical protein